MTPLNLAANNIGLTSIARTSLAGTETSRLPEVFATDALRKTHSMPAPRYFTSAIKPASNSATTQHAPLRPRLSTFQPLSPPGAPRRYLTDSPRFEKNMEHHIGQIRQDELHKLRRTLLDSFGVDATCDLMTPFHEANLRCLQRLNKAIVEEAEHRYRMKLFTRKTAKEGLLLLVAYVGLVVVMTGSMVLAAGPSPSQKSRPSLSYGASSTTKKQEEDYVQKRE
ncbi:hypothetical protein EK21DRAFT_90463 [Setomelanomma holmii]|uniref:Uncharacterized protein n=1 Tax=Setomelanomma holmii TaxID=210430 RepID=A0A9P4H8L2_9PLEO|nr:hypothetical protein EK21DRAFT_90463 [Setomelanomma holmii]